MDDGRWPGAGHRGFPESMLSTLFHAILALWSLCQVKKWLHVISLLKCSHLLTTSTINLLEGFGLVSYVPFLLPHD